MIELRGFLWLVVLREWSRVRQRAEICRAGALLKVPDAPNDASGQEVRPASFCALQTLRWRSQTKIDPFVRQNFSKSSDERRSIASPGEGRH
ncbi:hypothetical protein OKW43_007175 [Paraburkholderia sp. WC7.3g]|uniref:hypothetical protein n=1 Tax=Paraburkholderia sp. WC7.3g TaxID=2991070 RepID=UPI003D1ED8F4